MLRNLETVKEIEVLAEDGVPPTELPSESSSLLVSKIFIRDFSDEFYILFEPTTKQGNSPEFGDSPEHDDSPDNSQCYKARKIPKIYLYTFTNNKFPISGTIIQNKVTAQQIIDAAGYYLDQQPNSEAILDVVPLNNSKRKRGSTAGRFLYAGAGLIGGAIGGEFLEALVAPLNNIDEKIPVPFFMFTAFLGMLLSLCCRHCLQNPVSSSLTRLGQFARNPAPVASGSAEASEEESDHSPSRDSTRSTVNTAY